MDFETLHKKKQVLILCNRCAYARRNNKILCQVCRENYHGSKLKMCFHCLVKENPDKYVICEECGKNYRHIKYKRCALCQKKIKRSNAGRKSWKTRRGQGRKK
jgi:hypothetical protein